MGARISGSGADDRGPCFVALQHQLATSQIEATKSSCFLDSSGKLAAIEVPELLGVGGCECYALGHEETSQERLSVGERGDPALGVSVSTPRRELRVGSGRKGADDLERKGARRVRYEAAARGDTCHLFCLFPAPESVSRKA